MSCHDEHFALDSFLRDNTSFLKLVDFVCDHLNPEKSLNKYLKNTLL